MAIVAGVDEAGYGPRLGPLVVSGTAFRVPDELVGQCLWKALRRTCTSKVTRSARRLPIADSKKLYRPGLGLAALEHTALVMLGVAGLRPQTWRQLLETVAPESLPLLRDYCWYDGRDLDLPTCEIGDIGTRANAIRLDCRTQGIEFLGAFCEPLPEGHFNQRLQTTRNKAVVLLSMVLRVIERMRRLAPGENIRVCVDRLGGRQHYREAVALSWPNGSLSIQEESPGRSAYRLETPASYFEIEFRTEGESHHLPIALASVYSKYMRELYMNVFNGFWSGQIEGLRPTAGYYGDAERWLTDAAPAIARLRTRRELLVRSW